MKNHFSRSDFKVSKTYVFALGLVATLWFLIRVLPKPSRAKYPCMQAAAPLMSSFIIYLIGVSASLFSYKKFRIAYKSSKYWLGTAFLLFSIVSFGFVFLNESKETIAKAIKVTDTTFPVESNTPIGTAKGLNPGRVVWMHDIDATNESFIPQNGSADWFYTSNNSNESVIKNMLSEAVKQYAGVDNSTNAWDAIFKSFNNAAGNGNVGYNSSEIIAIKTNFTNSCCSAEEERMDNTPQLIKALLYELTVNAGVPQSKIVIGDPYRAFQNKYLNMIHPYYPNVRYVDGSGGTNVEQTVPTSESVLFFAGADNSGAMHESTLPQHYIDAKYFINMPCLKTHNEGGITLIAKNHQGSYLKKGDNPNGQSAFDMHYSLPANKTGSGKYRHTVDYMGHKDTGGKGLLYIIDGIWGGESWQGYITKYKSAPFNNDYPNSIFIGQDPVALESVCFDVLFNENVVDNSKADYPIDMKVEIADYLKQMASSDYWPAGLTYDPENDGIPLESLGVFEHWNNATDRQYSRNLGTGTGIDLVYYNMQSEINAPINCNSTSVKINIDGQANEDSWNNAEWNAIDQVWLPYGNSMSVGDFEGKYKVLWDEEYLYVLVEVVDDVLSDDHTNPLSNWWNDDCLEIFIDENQSKGDHECNNNAFAYHVSLSYDAIDLDQSCSGINYKDHVDVEMDTIGENTYLWELAFKIYNDTYDHSLSNEAESRVTLSTGKQMGLTVAYCDNDLASSRENFIGSVWVSSADQNNMYINADLFREMTLVGVINKNPPVIENQTYTISENASAGTIIGNVVASDADGDVLSYSITQSSIDGAISINASNGNLLVKNAAAFNYEKHQAIELLVEVSDGIESTTADVIVNIFDENDRPIIANQLFYVHESPLNKEVIGTVVATDEDSKVLAYSIVTASVAGAVQIDINNGELIVVDSSVFVNGLYSQITLKVEVSDELTKSEANVTIYIVGENELPVIEDQEFRVDENPIKGKEVGTIIATDTDGDALTYAIIQTSIEDAILIDSLSGKITINDTSFFDFETHAQIDLKIEVSDGAAATRAGVIIFIDNVNEQPFIENQEFYIDENPIENAIIGKINASDVDGDILTYSIIQSSIPQAVIIDTLAGIFKVNDASLFNHELNNAINIIVEVSDSYEKRKANIVVYIADVNEVPTIESAEFYVDENPLVGFSIGTVIASDPDGDVLSYSINRTSLSDAVKINPLSGELTVMDATLFDYETSKKLGIEVGVTDGIASAKNSVIINIDDVEELGVNSAETFDITIFPNPSNGMVTLENLNAAVNITKVEIYNGIGQFVGMNKVDAITQQELIKLDYKELGKGTYYLKIYSDNTVIAKVVTIQ